MQLRREFASRHENVPGVQAHAVQSPALHVVLAPHARSVVPSPSASQTRCVFEPGTHVVLPGVQSHAPQSPVAEVQLAPPPHETDAPYARPSGSQRWLADAPSQAGTSGSQTRATHSPALQDFAALHGVETYASPSASQTSRSVRLPATQRATFGAQICSAHTPSRHACVAPHAVATYAAPRASHSSRSPVAEHCALPGTHACGRQTPASQYSDAAHGASTRAVPVASQVNVV